MLIRNIAQRDQKNEMSDNWIPKFWNYLPLFGPSLCSVSMYSWSCSSLAFVVKRWTFQTSGTVKYRSWSSFYQQNENITGPKTILWVCCSKLLEDSWSSAPKKFLVLGVLFSVWEGREDRPRGGGTKFGSGKKKTYFKHSKNCVVVKSFKQHDIEGKLGLKFAKMWIWCAHSYSHGVSYYT